MVGKTSQKPHYWEFFKQMNSQKPRNVLLYSKIISCVSVCKVIRDHRDMPRHLEIIWMFKPAWNIGVTTASWFLADGYSNQIVFVQLAARQFKLVARIAGLFHFINLDNHGGKQKWEFLRYPFPSCFVPIAPWGHHLKVLSNDTGGGMWVVPIDRPLNTLHFRRF